uniref:Uncharacterized protein n=1 Tax=Ditylenchus dipsaci TaxID=166011 RepID=A0A915D7N8_9BILA
MDDVRMYSIALIAIVLSLILLLILLNCCLSRRHKVPLVHDMQYFDNILLLLERQEAVERSRAERMKLYETTDLQFLRIPRHSKPNVKLANHYSTPPRRQRSVSASQTDKLAKLKEDLEYFKVDHGVQIRRPNNGVNTNIKPILRPPSSSAPVQRRTWDNIDTQFCDLLDDAKNTKDISLGTTSDQDKSPKTRNFPPPKPSIKRVKGMETTV